LSAIIRFRFPAIFLGLLLAGCGYFHQPGLILEFVNHSSATLHNIEVDFPGGSFGIPDLPPGGRDRRWIKVNGSGPLKAVFSDAAGEHRLEIISLTRRDSGSLEVDLQAAGQFAVVDQRHR
jgi:hypothetical protein